MIGAAASHAAAEGGGGGLAGAAFEGDRDRTDGGETPAVFVLSSANRTRTDAGDGAF